MSVRAIPELVSPTSIRSRILKGEVEIDAAIARASFTHVDPFEDTESTSSCPKGAPTRCFTHVDPFEDTERKTS